MELGIQFWVWFLKFYLLIILILIFFFDFFSFGLGFQVQKSNPIPVLEGLVLQLVETGGERWPKLWMWVVYMLLSNAAMGCLQMGFHIKVLIAKMTTKSNFIFLFWIFFSVLPKKRGKFWIFLSSVKFYYFLFFFGELREILDIWKLK
jgi:hypothetical protein